MAIIRRTNPMRALHPIQDEVNRLFDDFFAAPATAHRGEWPSFQPAIDVADTEDEILVTAEVPGLDPKDIDVNMHGSTLTLSGEKKQETEEKGKNFLRVERMHGSFSRSIELPDVVDPEKVQATAKNGVLTVKIGKTDRARPRAIQVQVTD